MKTMQRVLDNLTEEIKDYYNNVSDIPLIPATTAQEIREHLKTNYSFDSPIRLEELTNQVRRMLRDWTLHANHPQYFGLFVPGTFLSSIIADALVALYNPQLGVWTHAPGACEIERFTLQYFLRTFGMPEKTSSANFTTGGTEANLSAVLTALIKYFPEYGDNGMRALEKQPVLYVSEEAHHSFLKIGQLTGLGYKAVRNVPTDDQFRLDFDELKKMYSEDCKNGFAPFMVVGTAGTTSGGVIDPLPEIADFCKEHNLWFHADAAYGGAAIMSEKLKQCLNGIEQADSITCDAHKWFSVSMSAGMFFCRHDKYVKEAFHAGAAYLPETVEGTIDAYGTTLQCSRRFIGLKLFMSLAELGKKGYGDFFQKQAALGDILRQKLREAGFKIVNNTPLPVVCFTHKKIQSNEITTDALLERIYANKEFWISSTKLKNKIPVLRACITSFRTESNDVENFVKTLNSIIRESKTVTV